MIRYGASSLCMAPLLCCAAPMAKRWSTMKSALRGSYKRSVRNASIMRTGGQSNVTAFITDATADNLSVRTDDGCMCVSAAGLQFANAREFACRLNEAAHVRRLLPLESQWRQLNPYVHGFVTEDELHILQWKLRPGAVPIRQCTANQSRHRSNDFAVMNNGQNRLLPCTVYSCADVVGPVDHCASGLFFNPKLAHRNKLTDAEYRCPRTRLGMSLHVYYLRRRYVLSKQKGTCDSTPRTTVADGAQSSPLVSFHGCCEGDLHFWLTRGEMHTEARRVHPHDVALRIDTRRGGQCEMLHEWQWL